jgi:protein O-mannosyl-transferase
MAYCYLATLYCSLRYWTTLVPKMEKCRSTAPARSPANLRASGKDRGQVAWANFGAARAAWFSLALIACLAGMASKEVMVSAPCMVLLFERTFITASFAKALRQSWPLYVGLAATWMLLLVVSLRTSYGVSAGFAAGVPAMDWWLTQAEVFLMYLKLSFWPWPLLIHYDLPSLTTLGQAWMFVLPVLALGSVTLVLLWRNHPAGYLCTAILVILAPTSLIPIPLEMAAERCMYLPLSALLILVVVGGYQLTQWAVSAAKSGSNASLASSVWIVIAAATVLAALTCLGLSAKRLSSYKSEIVLWQEVLRQQPNSFIAHNNLGLLLANAGRIPESIGQLQAAIKIEPDYLPALVNLGIAYSSSGRLPEAIQAFQSALRVDPDCFSAYDNLGVALLRMGRFAEAVESLKQALHLSPSSSETRVNLGTALISIGRSEDAIREFEAVLTVDPDNILVLVNSSVPLSKVGRMPEAIENLRHALRLQPGNLNARTNLGLYLATMEKDAEAMEHFRAVLERNPNDANVQFQYAILMLKAGRAPEAIPHLQHAVASRSDFVDAFFCLAQAYRAINRVQDAVDAAQRAIDLSDAGKQLETATRIREWLKQYQAATQSGGTPARQR